MKSPPWLNMRSTGADVQGEQMTLSKSGFREMNCLLVLTRCRGLPASVPPSIRFTYARHEVTRFVKGRVLSLGVVGFWYETNRGSAVSALFIYLFIYLFIIWFIYTLRLCLQDQDLFIKTKTLDLKIHLLSRRWAWSTIVWVTDTVCCRSWYVALLTIRRWKSLENSQDFFVKTKNKNLFLKTKTTVCPRGASRPRLVSRTTSLKGHGKGHKKSNRAMY